ncbi:hypothetical protein D0862_07064 [Hortaea werneckii]|uniref:Uncharacterized protein n=1 Tax=Hortaea werneckii TaxID=91943 RepID=A0A3M7GEM3_HORWE|nr:hypothetical protein D0862_07064 [Hortaea werneckii]
MPQEHQGMSSAYGTAKELLEYRTNTFPFSDLSEAVQKPKETGEQAKNLATADHHKANPGPVMAENLGQPASKEELKKRAEELNKK